MGPRRGGYPSSIIPPPGKEKCVYILAASPSEVDIFPTYGEVPTKWSEFISFWEVVGKAKHKFGMGTFGENDIFPFSGNPIFSRL